MSYRAKKRIVSAPLARAKSEADHLRKAIRDGHAADALTEEGAIAHEAARRLLALPYYAADSTVSLLQRERGGRGIPYSHYRHLVALEHGFPSWDKLVRALENAVDRTWEVKLYRQGDSEELMTYELEAPSRDIARRMVLIDAEPEWGPGEYEAIVATEAFPDESDDETQIFTAEAPARPNDDEYIVYHSRRCTCGADLTLENSILVAFSDGNRVINEAYTSVDASGRLFDPTGQVRIGQHAGSSCAQCHEQIDELAGPDDSEDSPKCQKCGSKLDRDGFCRDVTCPYSDYKQALPYEEILDRPARDVRESFPGLSRLDVEGEVRVEGNYGASAQG